jgi:hypothetical protein
MSLACHQNLCLSSSLRVFRRFLILLAPVVLVLSRCGLHGYYAPNALVMPMVEKRHDAHLRVAVGSGGHYTGMEATGVYSPLRYGLVMANYFRAQSRPATGSGNKVKYGYGHLIEGGLGGYYPLRPDLMATLLAGWGAGSVHNRYVGNLRSDLNFQRWFIQPGLMIHTRKTHFGLGLRLSNLAYGKGTFHYEVPLRERNALLFIDEHSPFLLKEFGAEFGFDGRDVHVSLQTVSSFSARKGPFFTRNVVLSMGMDLERIWRKKEN